MKANELRIGNLVRFYGGALPANVRVNFMMLSNTEMAPDISPIPLTEELLLKFGFGEHPKGGHFKRSSVTLVIHMTPPISGISLYDSEENFNNGDYVCIDSEVIYVHQLQNLYFALTGEELTTS